VFSYSVVIGTAVLVEDDLTVHKDLPPPTPQFHHTHVDTKATPRTGHATHE
jgi:hypothetical protein